MKHTHISEIMSKEKLAVLNKDETLGDFFRIRGTGSNCYIVNEDNVLQGVIDDRAILKYTAPLMAIVDQNNSRNLMDRIRNIPLSEIVEKSPSPLNLKSKIHEILQILHLESCSALPVLDDNGVLIGEITITSIFEKMGRGSDCLSEREPASLKAV